VPQHRKPVGRRLASTKMKEAAITAFVSALVATIGAVMQDELDGDPPSAPAVVNVYCGR
jgi:hypothetical protein